MRTLGNRTLSLGHKQLTFWKFKHTLIIALLLKVGSIVLLFLIVHYSGLGEGEIQNGSKKQHSCIYEGASVIID